MDDQQLILQWMQNKVNRRALGRALKHFLSPNHLVSQSSSALKPFFRTTEAINRLFSQANITPLQQSLGKLNATVIWPSHAQWPQRLNHLYDPPAWLICLGNPERLNDEQVAIVGSRNATPAGKRFAAELAESLADNNWTITSGLALGIDAAAHAAAVSKTVAVMGNGVDRPYPVRNKTLYQDIITGGGVVVSEALLGEAPAAWHFPARNRIIAALSKKLVVIEAARKSGSLISADIALDLGRDVYAVPGGVYAPQSEGCLALLKQGAHMVTEPADLGLPSRSAEIGSDLNGVERKVIEALAAMPMTQNELGEALGMALTELSQTLLMLELAGHIVHAPGGYHIR